MFDYIKGTIIEVETDYIVLDNNNIGYKICTANPYEFEKNTERIVYVYQQVREDAHLLFGFPNKETKKLFLKLRALDVKLHVQCSQKAMLQKFAMQSITMMWHI